MATREFTAEENCKRVDVFLSEKTGGTRSRIKKLADEECRKHKTGTHAEPTDMTSFTCRLLIPNHIYFRCVQ